MWKKTWCLNDFEFVTEKHENQMEYFKMVQNLKTEIMRSLELKLCC